MLRDRYQEQLYILHLYKIGKNVVRNPPFWVRTSVFMLAALITLYCTTYYMLIETSFTAQENRENTG
jgi:uncharacterized membrane protein